MVFKCRLALTRINLKLNEQLISRHYHKKRQMAPRLGYEPLSFSHVLAPVTLM